MGRRICDSSSSYVDEGVRKQSSSIGNMKMVITVAIVFVSCATIAGFVIAVYFTGIQPGPPIAWASNITSTSVVIHVNPPFCYGSLPILSYTIHQFWNSEWKTFATFPVNITSYSVTGLTPNITHYFAVAASNALGYGNYSNQLIVTLGNQNPTVGRRKRHIQTLDVHNCTFEEEDSLCGQNITSSVTPSCDQPMYMWERHSGATWTYGTGPDFDHTSMMDKMNSNITYRNQTGEGHYMYVDASAGSPGDTTTLTLEDFLIGKFCTLRFFYHMYGISTPVLRIRETRIHINKVLPSFNLNTWIAGCLELKTDCSVQESTIRSVSFVAERGDGPWGDIAIDDISLSIEKCPDTSINCTFADGMCGYVADYSGWTLNQSADGGYLAYSGSVEGKLISPSVREPGCVTLYYTFTTKSIKYWMFSKSLTIGDYVYPLTIDNQTRMITMPVNTTGPYNMVMILSADFNYVYDGMNKFSHGSVFYLHNVTYFSECPAPECQGSDFACEHYCILAADICDGHTRHCRDGRDETDNLCSPSLECDFNKRYACNYTFTSAYLSMSNYNWTTGILNGSVILSSLLSFMESPKGDFDSESCLQYKYFQSGEGRHRLVYNTSDFIQNLYIFDGFRAQRIPVTLQASLPPGNYSIIFEFQANSEFIHYAQIDDVEILNGSCHNYSVSCNLEEEFLCHNTMWNGDILHICLPNRAKCNRHVDCSDGSDEMDCRGFPPHIGYIDVVNNGTHANITCIAYGDPEPNITYYIADENRLVDGNVMGHNILGNSMIVQNNYTWSSYICVATNGFGSDHYMFDNSVSCNLEEEFLCHNTMWNGDILHICLPNRAKCNRHVDCSDGSDEMDCRGFPPHIGYIDVVNNGTHANITCIAYGDPEPNITYYIADENRLVDGNVMGHNILGNSMIVQNNYTWSSYICVATNGFGSDDYLFDSTNSVTSSEVRLVGGQNQDEGRVEVYFNGVWGTICDDLWDDNDAAVVCRMLGYSTLGATAVCCAQLGSNTNLSISLDDVGCTGNESSIHDCSHNQWYIHDCSHNETAGVRCGHGLTTMTSGTNTSTTTARTTPGNTLWTTAMPTITVIPDGCHPNPVPACIQYGFERIIMPSITGQTSVFEAADQLIFFINYFEFRSQFDYQTQKCIDPITKFLCGSYMSDCEIGKQHSFCRESCEVIARNCVTETLYWSTLTMEYFCKFLPYQVDDPSCLPINMSDLGSKPVIDGLRLVNGTSEFSGRLEVQVNGVWGTVCGSTSDIYTFDGKAAAIFCLKLGFSFNGKWMNNSHYGHGLRTHISYIYCQQGQRYLDNCVIRFDSDCADSNDSNMGLECVPANPTCDFIASDCGYYGDNWYRIDDEDFIYMMAADPDYQIEGRVTELMSPRFTPESLSSVTLTYKISNWLSGKYMLIVDDGQNRTVLWQMDVGKHEGIFWDCIDVRDFGGVQIHLVFAVENGQPLDTTRLTASGLVNVTVNSGSCPGVFPAVACTFESMTACPFVATCNGKDGYRFQLRTGPRHSSHIELQMNSTIQNYAGHYMIANATYGVEGDSADLKIPVSVQPRQYYLRYQYNMSGPNIGNLQVHVIEKNGATAFFMHGHREKSWYSACLTLPFTNLSVFDIVFKATRGNGTKGDIAIDDIVLNSKPCPSLNVSSKD